MSASDAMGASDATGATGVGSRTIPIVPAVSEEDLARRNWYLLIARLFRSPPDEVALAAIAAAAPSQDPPGGPGGATSPPAGAEPMLARAFTDLAHACADADPEAVRQEYDGCFLSVGKAEVVLNGSWYETGYLNDRPLVELRDRLAILGLARRSDIGDTEDHIAALCETMALMIASSDPRLASVDAQRDFFHRFMAPWYESLCEAIEHSGMTDFYKHAARASRAFLDVERQAFDFE